MRKNFIYHHLPVKMKRSARLLLPLVCFLFTLTAQTTQSQEPPEMRNMPGEQIQLHTDRSLYITGETVRFRADYLIEGQHPDQPISKVLYVELFNRKEDPLIQQKVALKKGKATGSFTIPRESSSGIFLLQAYTKYQRNFAPNGFARQQLVVVNPDAPPHHGLTTDSSSIRLAVDQGRLVEGKENQMAWFVPPQIHRQTDSLRLANNRGQTIKQLNTASNGLGAAKLIPNDSTTYHMEWLLKNKDTLRKNLPGAQPAGLIANVSTDQNNLTYSLQGPTPSPTFDPPLRIEIINQAYQTCFEDTLSKKPQNGLTRQIPLKKLSYGIHYILLWDKAGKMKKLNPVYIPRKRAGTISVKTSEKHYGRKQPVQLELEPDFPIGDQPVSSMISVVRTGTNLTGHDELPASCILHPELLDHHLTRQGKITKSMKQQIRNILLLWEQNLNPKAFLKQLSHHRPDTLEHLPEYRDLTISGTLLDGETGQPVPDRQVAASVLFNNPQVHLYQTQANGEFIFTLHDLKGAQELYISPYTRQADSINYKIQLNRNFSPLYPDPIKAPFPLEKENKALVEELMINSQLQAHFKKPTDTQEVNDKNTTIFPTRDQISIELDEYIDLETMEQVFLELVPHARIRHDQSGYHFEVLNDQNYALPGAPLLLLDNLPVYDAGKLVKMHPSMIDKIEVINRTYMVGAHAFNGIIMFTTNTDNFGGINFPESSIFTTYQTLQPDTPTGPNEGNKSFNQPGRIPDFRTTLYWNPDQPIKNQPTPVIFNTSDRTGAYKIIVRGYTRDGKLFYGSETFEVKRQNNGPK